MFKIYGQKNIKPNGSTYPIITFENCLFQFVDFCLMCPCGLLYMGRIIQTLRARFGEDKRCIEEGNLKHNVPQNCIQCHQKSTEGLHVWVIESIPNKLSPGECLKKNCEKLKHTGSSFWNHWSLGEKIRKLRLTHRHLFPLMSLYFSRVLHGPLSRILTKPHY